MQGDLLPCPFCGGEATLEHSQGNENWNKSWQVKCNLCDIRSRMARGSNVWQAGSVKTEAEDAQAKAEAIAAWNTRTARPAVSEDDAELVAKARQNVAWMHEDCDCADVEHVQCRWAMLMTEMTARIEALSRENAELRAASTVTISQANAALDAAIAAEAHHDR